MVINDIELYEIIDNPVIVIDSDMKVMYVNTSSLRFFKLKSVNDMVGININIFLNLSSRGIESIDEGENVSEDDFEANIYANKISVKCHGYFKRGITEDNRYLVIILSDWDNKNSVINEEKTLKDNNDKYKVVKEENGIKIHPVLNNYVYKYIVENSSTGIVVEEDGVIKYINEAACTLLDVDRSCQGHAMHEFINVKDIDKDNNIIKCNKILQDEGKIVLDKKIICRSGKKFYAEFITMCANVNDKLMPIYLIKDISNRIEKESRLARHNSDLFNILDNAPVNVAVFINNKLFMVNKMISHHIGAIDVPNIDIKEFLRSVDDKYIDKVKKMYINAYYKQVNSGFEEIEIRNIKNDYEKVEICFLGFKVYTGNMVAVIIRTINDNYKAAINKIKLEEALKYDNLKSEFISNLTHEFRTPLNLVISTIQVSEKMCVDCPYEKYRQVIKNNTYRLLRLIDNWIDLTKILSGDFELDFKNDDIVQTVEDITMAAAEKVKESGRSIIFDTDIEEKVMGFDKRSIERVMLNLLSNAVKFSGDSKEIYADMHDLGDRIQISVRDNGVGIPKEMQDRVFDKFVQTENLFTRCHEGSGLGLSIVKAIIDIHKGRIYVKSEEGSGSTFIFELPYVLYEEKESSDYYQGITTKDRVEIEFSDIYM